MRNDELPREGLSSEQSEPSKESGQPQPKEDWRQSLFEWLQLLVMVLVPVLVLVVVMLLDYATGMAKAWNAGELSSRVGLRGILKKVGYVATVGVAAVVDWLLRYGAGTLGWDWPVEFLFASIVIIWLVINELLSILENVSAMGAPVPDFVQSLLQKLKGHTEHTMEGEEERND